MSNAEKKLLTDILVAIQSINEYVGNNRTFQFYESNKQLRRSVEREIEIIGEAVNKLMKLNEPIILTNAKQIINTRNKIIHAYDAVNNSIIWGIVINHLPLLLDEVNSLLLQAEN